MRAMNRLSANHFLKAYLYGPVQDTQPIALAMESHEFQLYHMFDRDTFKLMEEMCQTGDQNAAFQKDLDNLVINNFSVGQYERWKSIMNPATMPEARWKEFKEQAILLAGIKADLREFNEQRLLQLKMPIYMLSAVNRPPSAKSLDSSDTGGLVDTIFIAKGSRILLTRNLWTEAGLVNGADGIVEYIIFRSNTDFSRSPPPLPDVLLVRFNGYHGPSYLADLGIEGIVPIVPMTHYGIGGKNENFSRTQYPLLPGYGITIHKAQGEPPLLISICVSFPPYRNISGMTLNKVIVKICQREFSAGLLYTGCSRVKEESGLAILGYNEYTNRFPPIQR